jgi:RNA polymerase sigma-70 factor (ECF subfamily)
LALFHFLRNSYEVKEAGGFQLGKTHKIKPDLSFSGYILTMIKNTVFNESRKKMYHRAYVTDVLKVLQTPARELEERITYDDLLGLINKTIRNMPPKRQEIFQLCRMEGVSHKVIETRIAENAEAICVLP